MLACALSFAASGCDDTSAESTKAPPTTREGPTPTPEDRVPAQPWKHVILVRTPDGGIQPQALERKGVIHLVYLKGDPAGSDIYYVTVTGFGENLKFSKPLRVNSQPGSAIAIGTVRGAHLGVGYSGRPHVAWMGSAKAKPKAPGDETPMLYSRLNDEGTAFEPQRNLIKKAVGLNGGASIAAEGQNVWVYWHAAEPGKKGEENRRIWMVGSGDEGKTFNPKEIAISPADTGVCGCCGMRAYSMDPGRPVVLYRSASKGVHRDTYFLHETFGLERYHAVKLDEWETENCPMSTWGLHWIHEGWLAAWETKGQVYYQHINYQGKPGRRLTAPGKGGDRKHPVVCFNGREILLAWTEGTGWQKGGTVAWQVFVQVNLGKDQPAPASKLLLNTSGRVDGVPVWGSLSAVRQGDGFVLFY
jgi:hypothetical protein